MCTTLTLNNSIGSPTTENKCCHKATSVFLAQWHTVSKNCGNSWMNATIRGSKGSIKEISQF